MSVFLPALISFALCFFLLRWLLRGRLAKATLDQPNHRSLHSAPTPRIGGLAVLAGILAGGALAGGMPPLLFVVLGLLGGFCFLDDRFGLSAALRLPVHLLAAAVWIIGTAKVGASGTANGLVLFSLTLALGWMMNLYNFMDGANGLAGGMAVFGFGAYGAAAWLAGQPQLAALACVVAAAALAFLCFNFDPARVFLGDVGSIPLGFLVGALGLWGWQTVAWPWWFPLLVFSPFIVDATVTLARRGVRGEKVWQAHHDHAYQRLIRSGWSHRRLAVAAYFLMAACAASALVLRSADRVWIAAGLVIWGLVYASVLLAVERRWRQRG
jgi:UDP-N-acetylmuramyl pentapeptide phosphotransferase/UDP-N-acetylglucosamine-1-phosphate transferase